MLYIRGYYLCSVTAFPMYYYYLGVVAWFLPSYLQVISVM